MKALLALLVLAGAAHATSMVSSDARNVRVTGALTKLQIGNVVASHRVEVQACYEAELAKVPTLTGRLVVHFTIDAGKVTSAVVEDSTLGNALLESCVVTHVKTWTFPLAAGTVDVSYPYVLLTAQPPNGALSKKQIGKVVLSHQAALQFCYENELQRFPHLTGSVKLYWRVEPEGRVSHTRVDSSSLHNQSAEGCIARQVETWTFPTSNGPTNVTFPFFFKGQ